MPLNMRFRFSPTKDGLVKVLGPLETEIMQTIWQDERSTVKKVHRKLSQQRDIAYTTVMTTMSRLAEKGVLNRHREGLAVAIAPHAGDRHGVGLSALRRGRQRSDVAGPDVDEQLGSAEREDLGGHGLTQSLVGDVQRGVFEPGEGDEGFDPCE